jgi:glutaredoxin
VFSLLQKWLGRRARQERTKQCPERRFLMVTRQDCHLCSDAWKLLQTYQKRHGFALEALDVDSDADLVAKYGNCVPVVLVDGQVRFRGRVNEVLLRRLLEGAR